MKIATNHISVRCPKNAPTRIRPWPNFPEGWSPWTPPPLPPRIGLWPISLRHCNIVPSGLRNILIDRFRPTVILYTNTISTWKQAGSNIAVTSKTYLEISLKLLIIGVWNKNYKDIKFIFELPKWRGRLQVGLFLVVLYRLQGMYYA